MIRRALLSVSDKTGIAEFAKRLESKGVQFIATGGTSEVLKVKNVSKVRKVEDVTGFPECFGGRVKTIHPKILGGILMRRGPHFAPHGASRGKSDEEEAKELGMEPIDLVVVNLYSFDPTSLKLRGAGEQEYIELIDIGGPTLLRAAAKNAEFVTVVCDLNDYDRVASEIEKGGDTSPELRRELAAKAFLRTAMYDAAIAEWASEGSHHGMFFTGGKKLRYGENPHQSGKIFLSATSTLPLRSGGRVGEGGRTEPPPQPSPLQGEGGGVANAEVLQGKEMSYLNYLDADAAWQCVQDCSDPTAVFLKHASPCGVASNSDILQAFRRGYDSDPRSAFGVIIALNRPCEASIVQEILDRKIFVEILAAPDFDAKACALLRERPNLRVLKLQGNADAGLPEYRTISGGMLVQSPDTKVVTESDVKVVTRVKPSKQQVRDLLFAATVVKHVKSNAIVIAKDQVTVGIGPGQTSRVDAVEIAVRKAGTKAKGAMMASDAFLPFPDALEVAAKARVSAVIQPGGSIRDQEVIAAADRLGVVMAFTGVRAFRH